MRVVDLIQAKRDGKEITPEEMRFLLQSYLEERIPDYQMSAFLMAVYFQGMSDAELLAMTMTMRDSGDIISLPGIDKFIVDKHSTGGVGDKVTIVLAPILAALGMATAKISGRGLGHTGGTIDKFESIKGFSFSETPVQLLDITSKTGIGLMGQSGNIVPLDKKLYALRDVTATVPSIPLIAASVMSKKLAVQSDLIILDVKVGNGAFMKDREAASELARRMIAIGQGAGVEVEVILSNMDEPLGHAVGNACELTEAIEALKGNWPKDLKDIVYSITGRALKARGDIQDLSHSTPLIDAVLPKALEKLKEFIQASGGDPKLVDDPCLLPQPQGVVVVETQQEGVIRAINSEEIGRAAMVLGAGRASKEDTIDHAVGIRCLKKVGDSVKQGEPIAEILHNGKNIDQAKAMILHAYYLGAYMPVT